MALCSVITWSRKLSLYKIIAYIANPSVYTIFLETFRNVTYEWSSHFFIIDLDFHGSKHIKLWSKYISGVDSLTLYNTTT